MRNLVFIVFIVFLGCSDGTQGAFGITERLHFDDSIARARDFVAARIVCANADSFFRTRKDKIEDENLKFIHGKFPLGPSAPILKSNEMMKLLCEYKCDTVLLSKFLKEVSKIDSKSLNVTKYNESIPKRIVDSILKISPDLSKNIPSSYKDSIVSMIKVYLSGAGTSSVQGVKGDTSWAVKIACMLVLVIVAIVIGLRLTKRSEYAESKTENDSQKKQDHSLQALQDKRIMIVSEKPNKDIYFEIIDSDEVLDNIFNNYKNDKALQKYIKLGNKKGNANAIEIIIKTGRAYLHKSGELKVYNEEQAVVKYVNNPTKLIVPKQQMKDASDETPRQPQVFYMPEPTGIIFLTDTFENERKYNSIFKFQRDKDRRKAIFSINELEIEVARLIENNKHEEISFVCDFDVNPIGGNEYKVTQLQAGSLVFENGNWKKTSPVRLRLQLLKAGGNEPQKQPKAELPQEEFPKEQNATNVSQPSWQPEYVKEQNVVNAVTEFDQKEPNREQNTTIDIPFIKPLEPPPTPPTIVVESKFYIGMPNGQYFPGYGLSTTYKKGISMFEFWGNENDSTYKFKFIDDEETRKFVKDTYIDKIKAACVLLNLPSTETHGVETVEPGKVSKEGDDWKIIKQAEVRFIG